MDVTDIKIGDKFEMGYRMLEEGKLEGAYLFLEAVTDMYMLDAINDQLYYKVVELVANMDAAVESINPSEWIKPLFFDVRYGSLVLKPGDLIDNLKNKLNELEIVPRTGIVQSILEGELLKVKYIDNAFYTIQTDYEKNLKFLVRIENGNTIPMDFDIEDFNINRKDGRIEFRYTRGFKDIISIKPDGSDKKMIRDGKMIDVVDDHH